jgi:peptide subunit release factor 1 (eRF1)
VGHIIVIADRTGADIVTVDAQRAASGAPGEHETVEGSAGYPIHRTSTVDWSERHFQLRVENSWEANARDVAEATVKHAIAIRAALVLLVGDERARGLLREDLALQLPPHVEIVETAAGGRADGASAAALDEAAHDALLKHSWRRRREVLEHLMQNVGRRAFAVTGVDDVVQAVQRAQIDTLVLSDDPSSTLHAWIGPDATQIGVDAQAVRDMGVEEPKEERFDAALLRALAGSGAQLLITPNAHDYVRDGIGALLRYDDAVTPHP